MGFFSLLEVASMPVIQFLLIGLLGAFLASGYSNILSPTARSDINKVAFYVFSPSLVFSSLAKSVTLEGLISWWFMHVNIGIIFLIGGTLGWIAVKILRPGRHLEGLVISSCSAANFGNLVLILIPAICNEAASPFGDATSCRTRGLSYVSLSMSVCGCDRRGRVLGLGSGISKTAFHASTPAREIANQERCASEGMRGEVQTLKISVQQANEHKILEDRVATLMEKHDSRQESSGGSYCEGRGSNDSHLPSTCLVKNLRRKVVAIGRVNRDIAPSEEAYKIVLDNVYESQECLYDQEGTFGDVRLGDQITWPKGFVEFIGV